MSVSRKRFRIEEAIMGDVQLAPEGGDAGPMHREIMAELRALRAQMGSGPGRLRGDRVRRGLRRARGGRSPHAAGNLSRQIEQCEKLKVELDLIHDAINRTKREIATLHGKSFDGGEMAKVNGELGAVVGGTEQATQQILEATEAIDNAATALSKNTSPDQQKLLSENPGTCRLDLRGLQLLLVRRGVLGQRGRRVVDGPRWLREFCWVACSVPPTTAPSSPLTLAISPPSSSCRAASRFALGAVDGVVDQVELDLELSHC